MCACVNMRLHAHRWLSAQGNKIAACAHRVCNRGGVYEAVRGAGPLPNLLWGPTVAPCFQRAHHCSLPSSEFLSRRKVTKLRGRRAGSWRTQYSLCASKAQGPPAEVACLHPKHIIVDPHASISSRFWSKQFGLGMVRSHPPRLF